MEHCSANAEAMDLNPVEAPKTFLGLIAIASIAITTAMSTPSFHLRELSSTIGDIFGVRLFRL